MRGRIARQPDWTESIGVGSEQFVNELCDRTQGRTRLEVAEAAGGAWTPREPEVTYGHTTPKGG